jgi:hypothetical protein
MATYQLSGPASASATRRVIASIGGQAAGSYDTVATLTTTLTGTNNDLKYTSKAASASGNSIRVRYVDPGGNNAALGVTVSTNDITVNLATDGSGAITSTAAQVKTAVDGSAPAAALVSVANATGNDGTGVVTALAFTALSGGLSSTRGVGGRTKLPKSLPTRSYYG